MKTTHRISTLVHMISSLCIGVFSLHNASAQPVVFSADADKGGFDFKTDPNGNVYSPDEKWDVFNDSNPINGFTRMGMAPVLVKDAAHGNFARFWMSNFSNYGGVPGRYYRGVNINTKRPKKDFGPPQGSESIRFIAVMRFPAMGDNLTAQEANTAPNGFASTGTLLAKEGVVSGFFPWNGPKDTQNEIDCEFLRKSCQRNRYGSICGEKEKISEHLAKPIGTSRP